MHILALKACIDSNNLDVGLAIMNGIQPQLMHDIQIKTAFIEFYSHFNDITAALKVFRSMQMITMTSNTMNAILRGYINCEDYDAAIAFYHKYRNCSNDVSHILASIAYANTGDTETGYKYLDKVKCFYNPRYLEIDRFLDILCMMKLYPLHKDDIKLIPGSFIVRAIEKCGINGALLNKVDMILEHLPLAIKDRLVAKTALISAYGTCENVNDAQRVFDAIEDNEKDTVCVGAMMKVFVTAAKYKEVLQLYERYNALNDDVSHLLALQCCAQMRDLKMGQKIDAYIRRNNLKHNNILIANALLHLYGKCGDIENAIHIFNDITALKKHDVVSIGSMLNAYCKCRRNAECIALFKEMKDKYEIEANLICYAIVLTACTQSTSFYFGEYVHNKLRNAKHLRWMLCDEEIQSPLISMYSKCGMLHKAKQIFDNIKENEAHKYKTNVSIWNAMIHGYGRNGDISKANQLFDEMRAKNIKADAQTFILFMNACSHSGDVEKGRQIWNDIRDNNIQYDAQLMTAFVDCLSRKSHLQEAYALIHEYEMKRKSKSYAAMWMSLLFGCNKVNDIQLAEVVFNEMQNRFKENDAHLISAKVLMSNIYVGAKEFEKANRIRNKMKHDKLKKIPAISEIDVFGKLHTFYASNKHHDACVDDELYKLYDRLQLAPFDYQPNLKCITRELGKNEDAHHVLLMHSEKIALVYGLIHTPKDYLLVINKNLRICNDCHNFIKLVSKLKDRKITVADANRVHVFHDGQCSCNEYY